MHWMNPGQTLTEIIHHPLYSTELAPTDYHIFRILVNHLRAKKFLPKGQLKMHSHSLSNLDPRKGINELNDNNVLIMRLNILI